MTFQIVLVALLATQAGSKLDNFDKSTSVNGKVLYNINKVWEKVYTSLHCIYLMMGKFCIITNDRRPLCIER